CFTSKLITDASIH
ncbi:hypothetical protein CP8484711_1686B, partial [Chlamydia psittaci 84-8471/1]